MVSRFWRQRALSTARALRKMAMEPNSEWVMRDADAKPGILG
jgi:hypothetical protein